MIGLGLSLTTMRSGGLNPSAALLAALSDGAAQVIMHPLEYGSMFQDRAGTMPVTESGQLVGQVLDIGGGDFHATAISDAARGVFRDVGGKRWIEYNGINTAYSTPALPAPGVDKAQVFSGLRVTGASNNQTILETSAAADANNGAIFHRVRVAGTNQHQFNSTGTVTRTLTFAHPSTPFSQIVCGLFDISAPSIIARLDGAQVAQSPADQGTGNFNPSGTYPLYYGARAGASLFLHGNHYRTLGPIVRFGTNATPEQIAAAEAYYTAGLPA